MNKLGTRGVALIIVGAAVLAPVALAAHTVPQAAQQVYSAPPPRPTPLPEETGRPAYEPDKPTAVIVLSTAGSNAADVLAPYEVLAVTGAFNTFLVAADPEPMPVTGGLDVRPDLTFTELAELLPKGPDVIIVPQVQGEPPDGTGPIAGWLRDQQTTREPVLVSVCVGAEVLAGAGILDGRPATSHWLKLIGLRRDFPQVDWRDDVRYVDDGDVITSAGVLSGVDAALRVVERLVGQQAATAAAAAVRWPTYSASPAAPAPRLAAADSVALFSAAFRWDRPRMGVLLTDGVGEIELASAQRPYSELSYLARPVPVSLDGQPVRSRHGLRFVPRGTLANAAPQLDRLVVPGADARHRVPAGTVLAGLDDHARQRLAPVYLLDGSGFAVDGALRDIVASTDLATAEWVAKSMQYQPAADTVVGTRVWPWRLTGRVLMIMVGGAGLTAGLLWLIRQEQQRRPLSSKIIYPPRGVS